MEESFGQKVVLTKRIASVLRGYPEGLSVFNELLQNADDAGADRVAFCLDLRHHATRALLYPGMKDFSGVAVCVEREERGSGENEREREKKWRRALWSAPLLSLCT